MDTIRFIPILPAWSPFPSVSLRFIAVLAALFSFFSARASEDDYVRRIRDAELQGDRQAVAQICREWYDSKEYSVGNLDWCYNALMSLEENAILVTQNDHDTYPIWMLQSTFGVRQDVSVWNLSLLEKPGYRSHLSTSVLLKEAAFEDGVFAGIGQWLLEHGNLPETPVYFSVLTDRARLGADPKHLYLTGLAIKYSKQAFDNVAVLRANYEQRFRLDGLDQNWVQESRPEVVSQLNMSYVPAFLLLQRHYENTGELDKSRLLEARCLRIGRAAGREREVRAIFHTGPPASKGLNSYSVGSKDLEKRMKKMDSGLYVAETEVTNGQYEQFLQDLLRNKEYGLLDTCKVLKTDWRALLPTQYRQLSDAAVFRNAHPDESRCPVQNIRYEAALAYCQWLTDAYNQDTGKKKFGKVLFRLPTEQEWKDAARQGVDVKAEYPWGGIHVRNSKGCYLGNFLSVEPCEGCDAAKDDSNDGGFFPVMADTYYPNKGGLYNLSGNVAEMVAEKGIAKGGSWEDLPHLCQFTAQKKYERPSPAIGFRVVMEVLTF
jgi:formylglycine-generating enzyme required for sulfatase activity